MRYLLDTDFCINTLRTSRISLIPDTNAIFRGDVVLCSVVVAELLVGALKSRRQADTLQAVRNFTSMFASLPFNDACAEQYARIRALLEKSGQIIGPNDLMIAATALANDCALVTHNVSEFGRIQGLQIENWQF